MQSTQNANLVDCISDKFRSNAHLIITFQMQSTQIYIWLIEFQKPFGCKRD